MAILDKKQNIAFSYRIFNYYEPVLRTSAFERKITLEIRVIEGVSEISTLFWMNIDSVIQGEKLFGISSIIASGMGSGRI